MRHRETGNLVEKKLRGARANYGKEVEMVRWTTLILILIVTLVIVMWLRSDSTIYVPGYSWSRFSSIRNGMTPAQVTSVLGQPLDIEPFDGEINCSYPGVNFVADLSGKIKSGYHYDSKSRTDEMVGKSLDEVRRRYGTPEMDYTIPRQTIYLYSKLRNVKGEYVMLVHFNEEGKVYQIDADRIGYYCSTPGEPLHPSGFLEWLEWHLP
jgi:outer membrane protein assembly factor BamE (lipoprotein component of BamABCDE complex)